MSLLNSFCHFGGHDPNTSRVQKQSQLRIAPFLGHDNTVSQWLVCQQCIRKFNLNGGQDHTMNVLLTGAHECSSNIDELPVSLKDKPLQLAHFIQHLDAYLDNIRKTKFGNRFPIFLTDLNETEKKIFSTKFGK